MHICANSCETVYTNAVHHSLMALLNHPNEPRAKEMHAHACGRRVSEVRA